MSRPVSPAYIARITNQATKAKDLKLNQLRLKGGFEVRVLPTSLKDQTALVKSALKSKNIGNTALFLKKEEIAQNLDQMIPSLETKEITKFTQIILEKNISITENAAKSLYETAPFLVKLTLLIMPRIREHLQKAGAISFAMRIMALFARSPSEKTGKKSSIKKLFADILDYFAKYKLQSLEKKHSKKSPRIST